MGAFFLAVAPLLSAAPWAAADADGGEREVDVWNLGLACVGEVALSGPYAGVLVDEAAAGGVDRNGDGDADDLVLHVVDTRRGDVLNTGLATTIPTVLAEEGVFVVSAVEAAAGTDLNRDGDQLDTVPIAFDADAGVVRSSGLASSNRAPFVRDGRLYLYLRESGQGGDLNGDGDAADDLVAWLDLATGVRALVPLATVRDVVPFRGHVAVEVRESAQGGLDLNGDGDLEDEVLHVVRLADGATTNLGQDTIGALDAGGGLLVYRASEFGDGVDYDGDGRIGFAGVLHVYDVTADAAYNLARPGTFFAASPEVEGLVFYAAEVGLPPYAVYALDAAARTVEPLGIDTREVLVAWQTLVAAPSQQLEPAQVADALSGATWTLDQPFYFARFEEGLLTGYQGNPTGTLRAFEAFPPRERQLAPATTAGPFATDRAGALASWVQTESSAGADLNGDGDTLDSVLRFYDPAGDRVHELPLAVRGCSPREHAVAPDRLVFLVDEAAQGGTDLSGDGDALDHVLHVATLRLPAARVTRYGEGLRGWRGRAPHLELVGAAAPPRELVAQVRRARPGAAGVVVVGVAADRRPLFGGELLVAPPFVVVGSFVAAKLGLDGLARTELGVLSSELVGTPLYLQVGVVDGEAVGGVALSGGVRVVVGG